MTLRRLELLQWIGLLLGAATFAAAFVVGFGISQAASGAAGFGIDVDAWQGTLLGASAALVVAAGAAATTVVVRTRPASYESDPPPGRIRFLAIAALVANLLFLGVVVLAGIAAVLAVDCRQA